MTTGELIRKYRKEAGLTQKELGARSGIAEPTIRKYESNRLKPKIETIRKIANALGVSSSQLYPGEAPGQYFHTLPKNDQDVILQAVGNNVLYAEIAAAYLALSPDQQAVIRRLIDGFVEQVEGSTGQPADNEQNK